MPKQAQGKEENSPKEATERQKKPTERQKPERGTENRCEQHENSILPFADKERQKKISEQEDETKAQIEQLRQPFCIASQTAQEVIHQRVARSEQDGREKLTALKRKRKRHQPNRRRKNPPARCGSS